MWWCQNCFVQFPSHSPLCLNLGWSCSVLLPVRRGVCFRDHLLTLASTVLEIRGWIPRGCWCRLALWFDHLYYMALSSLLPSSSGKQSPLLPISPCVIEYLSHIWFEGERFLRCPPHHHTPSSPRPATQHSVIEARKMWLSFSASGTRLINYMLASTFNSSQVYPNSTSVTVIIQYVFIWVNTTHTAAKRFLWQSTYSICLCGIINVNKPISDGGNWRNWHQKKNIVAYSKI